MKLSDRIAFLLAMVIFCGFFLPWFRMVEGKSASNLNRTQIVKEISSQAQSSWWQRWLGLTRLEIQQVTESPFLGLSAWDLIQALETGKSRDRVASAVSQVFMKDQRTEDKRFFFWIGPVIAALSVLFLLGCRSAKWALLLPLGSCLTLYFGSRHLWMNTSLDRLTIGLVSGPGLWLTLYGLLGMAMILLFRTFWTAK